ncbi:hypothetical protein KIW84_073181 [Lathyrus oleraceus]|uniref:Cyclin-dependent kinase inhibitor domain-containing protein n=1 Tax=Pisum sativum TaxID=3888 RepID=A0A9D4VN67_PEA|nr:hypothetical protein KIW84_073181 [Pisum sativum]
MIYISIILYILQLKTKNFETVDLNATKRNLKSFRFSFHFLLHFTFNFLTKYCNSLVKSYMYIFFSSIFREEEIDEFFARFEREEQKRFSEKYNFDIVRDMPLEGRYEWVHLH